MKKTNYNPIQKSILFLSLLFVLSSANAKESVRLNIYTTNYPLKFFTESIAGKHATVTLPMPKDIDPAFWNPKPEDVVNMQKSDMIILNGANYEKWLPKVSLSLFKLVNTTAEYSDSYIFLKNSVTHQHGTGGKHSHSGTAFTTWLDFSFADKQAQKVTAALSRKKPDLKDEFNQNFIPLHNALLEMDKDLIEIGKALKGQALLASHPVYKYMKRRYQLNLESVHWEPEDTPTVAQWDAFKQLLAKHPAKWMIWEGKPTDETVAKLDELGVKVIVFSPIANVPENANGDFLSIMHENINKLKTINNNI